MMWKPWVEDVNGPGGGACDWGGLGEGCSFLALKHGEGADVSRLKLQSRSDIHAQSSFSLQICSDIVAKLSSATQFLHQHHI